jgi:hypothetical protein
MIELCGEKSGPAPGGFLGILSPAISLKPMSNLRFQIRFLAAATFFLVEMAGRIHAQKTEPSSGQQGTNGAESLPSQDTTVRPLKRQTHLPKQVPADWTTLPSTYTHDPTGLRVDQFAQAIEPESNERPDFVRSGYRHSRSSLQAGFSSDHYHVTEQWGPSVQPYGNWRYPYRPFSVPYSQWGPQLPQVVAGGGPWMGLPFHQPPGQLPGQPPWGNGNSGAGGMGNGPPNTALPNMAAPSFPNSTNSGNGFGPGSGYGPNGNGFNVGPWNALPASQDEYYPQAPSLRRP